LAQDQGSIGFKLHTCSTLGIEGYMMGPRVQRQRSTRRKGAAAVLAAGAGTVAMHAGSSAFLAPVEAVARVHVEPSDHASVIPSTTAASPGQGVAFAQSASSTLALPLALALKSGWRRRQTGRTAVKAKEVDDEVAALELEAKKLREGIAELEAARSEKQRIETERLFRAFDEDGSGAIDVDEIRKGLKEFDGTEIDQERAYKILKACDLNDNGVLELNEFDLKKLRDALAKVREAEREERAAQLEAEREAADKRQKEELKQKMVEAYEKGLPGPNQDTGIGARVASVFAYTLPVLDSVRFLLPIGMLVPQVQPITALLFAGLSAVNVIPFGQLIIFIAMQFISDNPEVPVLVRYNLKQAVALDIALFLPGILIFIAEFALGTDGRLSPELSAAIGASVIIPVAIMLAYCTVFNLLGMAPRGVPGLSNLAEMSMGVLPPSVLEEEERKLKEEQEKAKGDKK